MGDADGPGRDHSGRRGGRSKREVARDYGVSRRRVQVLVARYLAEGETAFEPRSRRPRSNPSRVGDDVEDAIVALRKQLTAAGYDAGAQTIAWHLREQARSAPPVSTIWRVLSRRGFVTPQPHNAPARPGGVSKPTSPTNAGRPTSSTGRFVAIHRGARGHVRHAHTFDTQKQAERALQPRR
ncbi:MAG: helix-turn-helix domain-containing protein [Geodermatophilaceae bacterium]|nr:helix-turn-helix domain-containing protein [Geodermatophilaceae bacterium]